MNAQSVRHEHHGALIRIKHQGKRGAYGYGCIHPWPELGDAPLEWQLEMLKHGGSSPLIRAARACAEADASARFEGVSLFADLKVPRSHATLPMDEVDFQVAVDAGFDVVKVKLGRNLEQESPFILEQAARYPQLRWRMDFNGTQNLTDIERMVSGWDGALRSKIDFLEDAYSSDESLPVNLAEICGVPLAVDRDIDLGQGAFQVAVIKPAVNEVQALLERFHRERKRVVMTSYMDHPLGQSYAAWQAALAAKAYPDLLDTCGLITHGLFEPNEFTEILGLPCPEYKISDGSGLGFDNELSSLPWK